jgi:hypothetical protein
MKRLQEQSDDGAARPVGGGDYFVVSGDCCTWYVSTEMARFIEACLDVVPPPRWVKFVDLTGARIRLRARLIDSISQCTAEQRASERAFHRGLNQERKADRSWDDDDD